MKVQEGMEFGELKTVKRTTKTHHGWKWLCVCQCGSEVDVRGSNLTTGHTKSCGGPQHKTRHGMSYSRPYRIYAAMIERCYRKKGKNFHNYGGRGITVCEHWRESFENFWTDMKDSYADNLSIERIDNNKGYSKENCKWATRHEQNNNTRRVKFLEHSGRRMSISQWAKVVGIDERTIGSRLSKGWSVYETLTKPVETKHRRKKVSA